MSRSIPAWSVAPWRNVVDLKYTCVIKEYTKYTTFIQGGHAASWSRNTEGGDGYERCCYCKWYVCLSFHTSATFPINTAIF